VGNAGDEDHRSVLSRAWGLPKAVAHLALSNSCEVSGREWKVECQQCQPDYCERLL